MITITIPRCPECGGETNLYHGRAVVCSRRCRQQRNTRFQREQRERDRLRTAPQQCPRCDQFDVVADGDWKVCQTCGWHTDGRWRHPAVITPANGLTGDVRRVLVDRFGEAVIPQARP